jgi:adhesin/invasin
MRKMALALVLLLLLPSCEDSDSVTPFPEADPNASFIGTFSPSSWTVVSGGSVGLYATVVDNFSKGLKDKTVVFGIAEGPGALSADTLVTGEDGSVQLLLMTEEGDLGSCVISASCGESSKSITVQVLNPSGPGGAGEPASIQLLADPASLVGNGHSSSAVTATVLDGLGIPVPNGTTVKFAAGESFDDEDGDGYFTNGVDTILDDADGDGEWDSIGYIDFSATTINGVALATYNSPEDTGTVYIKATAGAVSEDVTIELTPVPAEMELASIILDAPSPTLQVQATGGVETTPVTAYCYDAVGQPVGSNWDVEFEVMYGPGGGEGLEGHGYGPVAVLTDEEGTATVHVTSGTISGTMYVRAKSGEVYSAATQIAISAGPPAYISIGVNPGNIRGWDVEHAQASVSALVGDMYHNPVPENTAVYFTVDEGTIVGWDDSGVAFTEDGFANAMFFSGAPRGDGIVVITARTMGGEVVGQTSLITSGPPAYVDILSYPSSMPANTSAEGDVLVRVLDVNRNFVVNGTIVRFDIDYGSITPSAVCADGIYDSIAEATIYGTRLESDDSMPGPTDDGVGAIATVTAGSALQFGASSSVNVSLTTGVSRNDRSSVTYPDNIPAGVTVPMYVSVKDREGNPLGDHTISLSVNAGSVDSLAVTDMMGEAHVTFAAPDTAGDVLLTIRDLDPTYGGVVMFETIAIK